MKALQHYLKILCWFTPVLAYQLSDKSITKTPLLIIKLWKFVITRKFHLRNVPHRFVFTYEGTQFELVIRSVIDIAVLSEVFVLKEYAWDEINPPKYILDLGAHWGDTALYYAIKYPGARIISVEPSPHIFKRLEAISKQFVEITPILGAFGRESGETEFFMSENTLGNSMTRRSSTDSMISVHTFSIDDLCLKTGIEKFDLIKFDIEGGEQHIFSDPNIKKRATAFIGEIHLDLMTTTLEEISSYFSETHEVEFQMLNKNRYIVKAKAI